MDEMNTTNNEAIETEQETVSVGEAVEPQEEAKEDIPDELAGLPEDIAREAMKEANINLPEKEETDESEQTPADNSSNSDTKDEPDDSVLPNQKIPYSRFKHQVDKTKELEAELAKLKAQLSNNAGQNVTQQPAMAPGNVPLQQQPIQPAQPAPVINAEITEQIEQAIRQEAMRMSGLDDETVNSIEYMDSDDSRVKVWNTAQSLARQDIYRKLAAERQRQIDTSRRMLAAHNENVLAYNKFTQEQMQDPDFEAVKDFATNDYFSKLDGRYQTAIAEAYTRIEKNVGSMQDTMLIERYFTDAKNEYRKTHGASSAGAGNKSNETVKKVKQGQAFPRSGQISGSGNDGTVTAATLEQMLESTPFEQIPEQYQKILLGYTED